MLFELDGGGGDGYFLLHAAGAEADVDGGGEADGEADGGDFCCIETGFSDGKIVGPGGEEGEAILAGGVGFRFGFDAGGTIGERDGGAGDEGVGFISDDTGEVGLFDLRDYGERE